jgi:hypothetical protein
MKTNFHLVINKSGSVKAVKNKPGLDWDEVSVAVIMELPDMLFKKPQLQASIVIPDSAAVPKVIGVEVTDNIRNAIQEVSGLEVRLNIISE